MSSAPLGTGQGGLMSNVITLACLSCTKPEMSKLEKTAES